MKLSPMVLDGRGSPNPTGTISTVQLTDACLAEVARMGAAKILLTNRNHSRAANLVRARTGARTLIHPDDAAHARNQGVEVDEPLNVGETVGPFTIVAVPGKSSGEIALHWPARKLLIVGDAVIGNPNGHCDLLREKVMDDPARPRRSGRNLLSLEFDIPLCGDGASILRDANKRLEELVDTFPSE
jgi:glyoxylase-like metal-dependent hydrolase (beta-lactamase superfamily II)